MLGWLWRFFVGNFNTCNHTWQKYDEVNIVEEQGNLPYGRKFYLQCSKCGDFKSKKL